MSDEHVRHRGTYLISLVIDFAEEKSEKLTYRGLVSSEASSEYLIIEP